MPQNDEFTTNVDMRKITSPLNGLKGGRPSRRVIFERLMEYENIPIGKRDEYCNYLMNPYIKEIPDIREQLAKANEYFLQLNNVPRTLFPHKPKNNLNKTKKKPNKNLKIT